MQIPFTTRKRNSTVRRRSMQTPRILEGVQLFNIQHETGDLSEWDSTVTDSGDLSVVANGLRGSAFKMQCNIDSVGAIFGRKNFAAPTNGAMRFRFYTDADQVTFGDGEVFDVVKISNSSLTTRVTFDIKRTGANKQIRVASRDDIGGFDISNLVTISGETFIEALWLQALTSVSSDGSLAFYVDGALKQTLTGIDNFDSFADTTAIRMGAVEGIDAGTSGNLFLDELVVRDDNKQIGA